MSQQIIAIFLVLSLTVLSGVGDAQGFSRASKVWQNGQLIWIELVKSGLGFGFGAVMYWLALRYLERLRVVLPEVQTLLWFIVTFVGVAALNGNIFRWHPVERVVALIVLVGLGWLLVRTPP